MGILSSTQFLIYGVRNFSKSGYLRQAKNFDNSTNEADLRHLVIAVTGANQGLGYQTAMELAQRQATVVMVCRNQSKGQQAADQIIQQTGNKQVKVKVCDVSNMSSIKQFSDDYIKSGDPCHILINNAGVLINEQQTSSEGHEINFATNTLGTYYITKCMTPVLARSAPARVITVTSGGMYTSPLVQNFKNEDLKKSDGGFDGVTAYARDKRRQVAFTEHYNKLHKSEGHDIVHVTMHPGWAATAGLSNGMPGFVSLMSNRLRDLKQGCDTIVWLCCAASSQLQGGELYLDRAVQNKHFWGMGTKYDDAKVQGVVDAVEGILGGGSS